MLIPQSLVRSCWWHCDKIIEIKWAISKKYTCTRPYLIGKYLPDNIILSIEMIYIGEYSIYIVKLQLPLELNGKTEQRGRVWSIIGLKAMIIRAGWATLDVNLEQLHGFAGQDMQIYFTYHLTSKKLKI